MKRTTILAILGAGIAFAQPELPRTFAFRAAGGPEVKPIQGAPYTATVTNESVQTLADGNRIVQSSTGLNARDSMGRTRQEAMLPAIGGMSAAEQPHLVFITDPVAQMSYTLNLNEKAAHKSLILSRASMEPHIANEGAATAVFLTGPPSVKFSPEKAERPVEAGQIAGQIIRDEPGQMKTEDLGTQTIEGVMVKGVRTTRTIGAGQIGNDNPIEIVTEVWTSPDLKTIVYSKRSDPRSGVQTYRMSDIVRAEPDPSLFTVPSDFRVIDDSDPHVFVLRPNE